MNTYPAVAVVSYQQASFVWSQQLLPKDLGTTESLQDLETHSFVMALSSASSISHAGRIQRIKQDHPYSGTLVLYKGAHFISKMPGAKSAFAQGH